MKRAKCLVWIVLAVSLSSIAGFGQTNGVSSNGVINTVEGPMNAKDYQQAKEAAVAEGEREYQEKLRHPELLTNPPPSERPFPNYQTGPGRPLPNYLNFYTMDDHFPMYLQCEYAVEEKSYNPSDEKKWFKAALKQIRRSGPTNFPPVKWIAVAIRNVAEHKDASTFEPSFKVGAIFKASDVFDSSSDLSRLVAQAQMDRHPFKYDTSRPTPGEQQRWMIVEEHAANNPTTGPK
jgi:hypothetical protein